MAKKTGTGMPLARWLMLVHQLPAKPAYARVKIWRRLQELGAINLKNSVNVLPCGEDSRGQFTQLLKEIERHGGDGILYEADLVAGMRDDQLRALFNAARESDYQAVTTELRQLALTWKKTRKKPQTDPVRALARFSERLAQLSKIDFFSASGRAVAVALLAQLEHSAIARADRADQRPAVLRPAELSGKVWVTRRDIHVDRIACAWLIRRFVDPKAELKFVATRQYAPRPNEYRYDMQDGEFTHEGDACSFEVLLAHTCNADPALRAIGEIIHDIDLKDRKFGHPETLGIAHVISGICRTQGSDEARVARGKELFDDIYEQFRRANR
jgi:hypothetical protein